jgi:hypothetical protein
MARILAGLLAVALVATAAYPVASQEPKVNKEQPPKIAWDPAKLTGDLEYAIQGEYLGKRNGAKGAGDSLGAQVIALGNGTFEVKLFSGGLPGAGWNGKPPTTGKGTLDRNRVAVKAADNPEVTLGVLKPDTDTKNHIFILPGKKGISLSKIERKSPSLGAKPPKGAVVLFSGPSDADKWDKDRIAELTDGKFLQAGGVRTKQKFQSVQLHLEFRTAWMPGRERGNISVHLQDRYKLPVFDNFGRSGAEGNGTAAKYELVIDDAATKKDVSIKKALDNLDILVGISDPAGPRARQALKDLDWEKVELENLFIKSERGEMVPYSSFMRIEKTVPPKVNMCFPPMTWQTYDIDFTAPELNSAGAKTKPAKVTLKHNGVVVYDGLELKLNKSDKELSEPGSQRLQSATDFVMFNNIWAVVK